MLFFTASNNLYYTILKYSCLYPTLSQCTSGGLFSAELGLNQNLCQINGWWAMHRGRSCGAPWLLPSLPSGAPGWWQKWLFFFLLAKWNSRWMRIWASLLGGLKLLLFQKYMTCHRNIIWIKIWTLIFFFFPFHPRLCFFLLFFLPGYVVCHHFQHHVFLFLLLKLSLGVWFASRNLWCKNDFSGSAVKEGSDYL